MKGMIETLEQYFSTRCLRIALKLKSPARNTPHYHILELLQGGVTDTWANAMTSSLQSCQRLIRTENFETCWGSTFIIIRSIAEHVHETANVNLATKQMKLLQNMSWQTCNRMVYRMRKENDLNVVLYNDCLSEMSQCSINVKQTKYWRAVANLMKYAFKPPLMTNVQKRTRRKGEESSRNPTPDNIRSCIHFWLWAMDIGFVQPTGASSSPATWESIGLFTAIQFICKVEETSLSET